MILKKCIAEVFEKVKKMWAIIIELLKVSVFD